MPFITRRAGAFGVLLAGLASGLAAAPAAPPASTPSAATRALVANLVSNVDFLDRSSRFALDRSKNRRLRAFARAEAREQSAAIDALWDWTQGHKPPDPTLMTATTAKPALDTTPTGSTKPAWPPAPIATGKPDPEEKLPKGQEDLDSLEGLEGAAFDTDFRAGQQEALEQVAAGYAACLAQSETNPQADDPALKAIAQRELPKVRRRLAELKRL